MLGLVIVILTISSAGSDAHFIKNMIFFIQWWDMFVQTLETSSNKLSTECEHTGKNVEHVN